MAFFGVSAASLGFTRYLSDYPKQYAPLTGIMQGIGEIIGRHEFSPTYKKYLGLRLPI